MSIIIDAAVINDKGRTRSNNEDNFYFDGDFLERKNLEAGGAIKKTSRASKQVFAVCDGMGGVEAGEEASLCAASALGEIVKRTDANDFSEKIAGEIQGLSDEICRQASARGNKSGTTIAMLAITRGLARSINVGDSRVYLVRGGNITQLSVDHSEVQRMIAMGVITPEEGRTHPKRHMISQYLGMPSDEVRLSVSISKPLQLQRGDRFVLCTDGLTDMLEDGEILQITQAARDAESAAKTLVETALRRGGKDNVTVICLNVARVSSKKSSPALKIAEIACALISAASAAVFFYNLIKMLNAR